MRLLIVRLVHLHRARLNRRVVGALVMTVAALPRSNDEVPGDQRELELTEITSQRLSGGLGIIGGLIAQDGSVILLAVDGLWQLRDWRSAPTRLCDGAAIKARYATHSAAPTLAAVFDSATHAVVEIQQSKGCQSRYTGSFAARQSIVGSFGSRWAEVTIARRMPSTVRLIGDGGITVRRVNSDPGVRLGDASEYSARPDGDQIVISESLYPFRVFSLDSNAKLRVLFEPTMALSPETRAVVRRWRSLPALRLDSAYVQVLADPTSDRRQLLVFAPTGRLLRSTSVPFAVGIMDADPRQKTLLVLRNPGVPELVLYKWRWRSRTTKRETL